MPVEMSYYSSRSFELIQHTVALPYPSLVKRDRNFKGNPIPFQSCGLTDKPWQRVFHVGAARPDLACLGTPKHRKTKLKYYHKVGPDRTEGEENGRRERKNYYTYVLEVFRLDTYNTAIEYIYYVIHSEFVM